MGDAIERARAARNVLERLGRKVPGLAGYMDRELVREMDQLLRARLADTLDAARASVAAATVGLDLGAAAKLARIAGLDKDLDAIANAIRHAGSGYAGLFGAVKIGQEELEELHRMDVSLVQDVEAIAEVADRLPQSDDALDSLSKALVRLRGHFEDREQRFKGVLA